MKDAFVGIDVAFAKRKRLPIAICRWEADRLLPYPLRSLPIEPPRGSGNVATLDDRVVRAFARATARYLERVASDLGVRIKRIGIDAPSAQRPESVGRREAERALDDAGISCFATPSASRFEEIRTKVAAHLARGGEQSRLPHANQLWMIVGFALFEQLAQLGECIEVFPQATAQVLGAGDIHKFKAGGIDAQLGAVSLHTGWPESGGHAAELSSIAWAPQHDCLDAYLSAWVASLDEKDRVAFGSPPEDVIWAPRVEGREAIPVRRERPARRRPAGGASAGGLGRLCPACERFVFKRWPWGWDGHAAHACPGLAAAEPERRKSEFKERFGHLF